MGNASRLKRVVQGTGSHSIVLECPNSKVSHLFFVPRVDLPCSPKAGYCRVRRCPTSVPLNPPRDGTSYFIILPSDKLVLSPVCPPNVNLCHHGLLYEKPATSRADGRSHIMWATLVVVRKICINVINMVQHPKAVDLDSHAILASSRHHYPFLQQRPPTADLQALSPVRSAIVS